MLTIKLLKKKDHNEISVAGSNTINKEKFT